MSDYAKKAQELLDSADTAFDRGNVREGSRLVWEAARTGIVAVADKRGWPCGTMEEIKEVIYRLDGVDGKGNFKGSYPEHFAHFGVAEIFLRHAETDKWEYPEFKWSEPEFRMGRKSVKAFVGLLVKYASPENRVQ